MDLTSNEFRNIESAYNKKFEDPEYYKDDGDEILTRAQAQQADLSKLMLKDDDFEEGMFKKADKSKEQAVWKKVLEAAAAKSPLNQDKKKRAVQDKLFDLGKDFIVRALVRIDREVQRLSLIHI